MFIHQTSYNRPVHFDHLMVINTLGGCVVLVSSTPPDTSILPSPSSDELPGLSLVVASGSRLGSHQLQDCW